MAVCRLHLVVAKHDALLERLRRGRIIWNEIMALQAESMHLPREYPMLLLASCQWVIVVLWCPPLPRSGTVSHTHTQLVDPAEGQCHTHTPVTLQWGSVTHTLLTLHIRLHPHCR